MKVPVKLAAFAALLAALFGAGAAVGAAVGPIDVGPAHGHTEQPTTTEAPTGHGGHAP